MSTAEDAEVTLEETLPEPLPPAGEAEPCVRPQDQRILVVDDSVATRRLLQAILQSAGYQVMEAADAFIAQKIIATVQPDLILLDVMMPGLSGFELAEQLKQDPEAAAIPIIMLTALTETKDRVRGLQAGADDFLSKPFDRVELLTRAKLLLEKKVLADRLRQSADQLGVANARLGERVRLMSRLLILGHQLRGELAPEDVHGAVRQVLSVVTGVGSFSVFQRLEWSRGWQLIFHQGLTEADANALTPLPKLEGVLAQVAETRTPYFPAGRPEGLPVPGTRRKLPLLATLPLVADEQLIGLLAVHRLADKAMEGLDRDLLVMTAKEIGAALYNLNLYNRMMQYAALAGGEDSLRTRQRSLENRLQRLSTLAFFSGQLHATLNWEEVHNLIRRLSVDFIGVERLYVIFDDEQRPSTYLGTVRGPVWGTPANLGLERHGELIQKVRQTGRPVPRRMGATSGGERPGAVAVPLNVGSRTVGAIVVESLLPEVGGWTEQSWELMQLLADQAAPALMTASLYQKMSTLAITDGLTGIFNHRHFHERLADEWLRAERYHKPLALLMVEADGFKKINDTYGHLQGDAVLRDLAELFKRSVREVDVVSRYGGDEFTVILPETDLQGALVVAERIRRAVSEHAFPSEEGSIHVTVSTGVAARPPIADRNALVRAADDALYTAKRRGKDQVVAAS